MSPQTRSAFNVLDTEGNQDLSNEVQPIAKTEKREQSLQTIKTYLL